MITVPLPVVSGGAALDAELHLPDPQRHAAPRPLVVPVPGFQGLKAVHPERFARALVPRGYAVATFDHRGFGASGGPTGRVRPTERADDVVAVLRAARGVGGVDAGRSALLGWGLGGGIAISAAAGAADVRAVAAVNAVADAGEAVRHTHDEESWQWLQDLLGEDRPEPLSPWDVFRLDRDPATDYYVARELDPVPGFDVPLDRDSARALLTYRPALDVPLVAPRPLLVVHGTENGLHPVVGARELAAAAAATTELVLLDGAGHTEWMHDEHPTFGRLVEVLDAFLARALDVPAPTALPAPAGAG